MILQSYLINYLNQVIYNKMISRNINLRPNDITSIKNYYNPSQYKKRLNKPEGDIVLKNIKRLNPILPFVTHDIMASYKLFNKLNLNIKFIEIYRNPFELTYSWYKRNLAKNLEYSRRSFTLKIKHKNKVYPWYLHNLPKIGINSMIKKSVFFMLYIKLIVRFNSKGKFKTKIFYIQPHRDITKIPTLN